MKNTAIAKVSITIKASKEKVWDAITKPELVKKYLFGTELVANWKVGSPIQYRGEWQGKKYEDKGKVLEFEKNKKLVHTYFSSMSGKEDKEENYKTLTYTIEQSKDKTILTIEQDNNTKEEREHSEQNWNMVLAKLKEILEAKPDKNSLIKELELEGYSEVKACSLGSNFNSGEHTHDEYTVHIILEGELTIIDKKSKLTKTYFPGDRIEFKSGTTHITKGSKNNVSMIVGVKK